MAGLFTRAAVDKIESNAELTPEQRTEQIFALFGRALDEGYISRTAAQQAQETAINQAKQAWEKDQPKPNVLESEEYKKLQGEFDGYKAKQSARNSDDFKEVKPKFFDRVYDLIDRADGAKPVAEQLAALKKDYEEYFTAAEQPTPKPTFGAKTQGEMPKGDEGAIAGFSNAWGFVPKKT